MAQANEAKQDAAMRQPPPLRLSRVLHARRETVFKAWSSADHVKRWFSPETYTVPDARVEMRVGGPFEVCMRSPSGEEHWTRGAFVEVIPHTRLVIDMHAIDSAGAPLFRAYTEVEFSDALGLTGVRARLRRGDTRWRRARKPRPWLPMATARGGISWC